MDVVNRDSVEEFVTKDGSLIREILAPASSALVLQSLAEATLKPGQATQRHYHVKTEEIYYVLKGSAAVQVGGEKREIGPGDAVAIPPGSSHMLANTGRSEMVFLCCCAPAYSHEDTVMTQS
jgi:mannose-6-phosphate isomerase-like protein (cupin superfamily)